MKSTHFHWFNFAAVILFVLSTSTAFAQVPSTIGYSGMLADETGVFTGAVDIDLNMFDADGRWVWGEAHPETVVEEGAFWLSIGSHVPLPDRWDESATYLEFTINEQILEPRIALEAVPFAQIAESSVNPDGVFVDGTQVISSEGVWTGQGNVGPEAEISELLQRIEDLELAVADLEAAVYDEHTGLASRLGPDDVTWDGVVSWNDIEGMPADFADGVDNQVASVSWSAIEGMPAGFADGVDDQVASVGWDDIEGMPAGFADGVDHTGSTSVSWDDLTLEEGTIYQIGNELFFEGINVNIISGTPDPGDDNGLGNLIVGYQLDGDSHTGSHNLVVGYGHNYTGSGNIISGYNHDVQSDFGGVFGGSSNTVDSDYAVVVGGTGNFSHSYFTVAVGGQDNHVGDPEDTPWGGAYAVAVGGEQNHAYGTWSAALGGAHNELTGSHATAAGGRDAQVAGSEAATLGGRDIRATGMYAIAIGGHGNESLGRYSSVIGGGGERLYSSENYAYANYSVVVGGQDNETGDSSNYWTDTYSMVLGGYSNEALDTYVVIAGSGTSL